MNFSEDMKEIVAFRSLEGEVVNLLEPVKITDTVEVTPFLCSISLLDCRTNASRDLIRAHVIEVG